jgi:hypothetical protein
MTPHFPRDLLGQVQQLGAQLGQLDPPLLPALCEQGGGLVCYNLPLGVPSPASAA